MTNPTSNFGWQMPTSTDLVTDLPADFEVFGQAVDTSLADLKGGTTGQVLKKNTDADMDFVWSSDATGMTNPMTTTGDTIYSSSGSTPARLGIGTTGQVLTVSGGLPAWETAPTGGMTLLSTTTLSGAITTISSINQTYVNLFAVITNMTNNTADGAFRIALNGTTNSHDGVVSRFEQGGSATLSGFANNYIITPSNLARANAGNTFALLLPAYAEATIVRKTFQVFGRYTSTTASTPISISGMFGSTSAITSLAFSNSGGDLAGGTVYLYGVK